MINWLIEDSMKIANWKLKINPAPILCSPQLKYNHTMNSKITTLLLTLLLLTSPTPTLAQEESPPPASIPAWNLNPFCNDINNADRRQLNGPAVIQSSDPDNYNVATLRGIECIVGNLLGVAITLVGLGVLVMLIYASFQLLTSGGDPKAAAAAKGTATYAIIGLILALSSWFILSLLAGFTGNPNILEFSIQVPTPPPVGTQ